MNKQQIDQIIERISKEQEIVDKNYEKAYNAPTSLETEFILASCEAWYEDTVSYLEELRMKWC